jgi:hypothetical protein
MLAEVYNLQASKFEAQILSLRNLVGNGTLMIWPTTRGGPPPVLVAATGIATLCTSHVNGAWIRDHHYQHHFVAGVEPSQLCMLGQY